MYKGWLKVNFESDQRLRSYRRGKHADHSLLITSGHQQVSAFEESRGDYFNVS
jgi:hypothetical protein